MLQKECAVNMSVLLNAAFMKMYLVIKPTWHGAGLLKRLHAPGFEIYQKLLPRVSSTWPPYLLSNTLSDGKMMQEQTRFLMLVICLPVVNVLARQKMEMSEPCTSNFDRREWKQMFAAKALVNSHKRSSELIAISWFRRVTTTGISDMCSSTKIEWKSCSILATLSHEDVCPSGEHKNRKRHRKMYN